jgi:hypothetical protein
MCHPQYTSTLRAGVGQRSQLEVVVNIVSGMLCDRHPYRIITRVTNGIGSSCPVAVGHESHLCHHWIEKNSVDSLWSTRSTRGYAGVGGYPRYGLRGVLL